MTVCAEHNSHDTSTGDEFGMTAMFRRVQEFDSKQEVWEQYAERLGHFFADKRLSSEQKITSFSRIYSVVTNTRDGTHKNEVVSKLETALYTNVSKAFSTRKLC